MGERPGIDIGQLAGLERIAQKALRARAQNESSRAAPGRLRRNGMDYAEHRPYGHGDDVRRIDWRTSQRLGQAYVRKFDAEANADWMICLDRSASMSIDEGSKWQLAVQVAEAFAYLCLCTGQRFGLRVFSDNVDSACPLGRGHAHFATVANLLTQCDVQNEGGASNIHKCATGLRHGTALIVISDFLSESGMTGELDYLTATGSSAHLVQILSPRETQLPQAGVTAVRDIETGLTVNIEPHTAETTAKRTLQWWQQDLADTCTRQGIIFTSCHSDEVWRTVVIRHLESVLGEPRFH